MYTEAAVATAVNTQAAGGVRRIGEGYRIRPEPECRQQLPCYCQNVSGLRDIISQSLKLAEWPFRDDGPPLAIGTSLLYEGMVVGGSIQMFEDIGTVRVIAFGGVGNPGACRAQLDELIGRINPTLLDVSFEIDLVLQMPVCRAVVRVDESATQDDVASDVIRTLGSVTANFAAIAPAFLAITSDNKSVNEALSLVRISEGTKKSLIGGES